MNYDDMSDFEINKEVAKHCGSKKAERHCNASITVSLSRCVVTDFGVKDYCNNPSDAWPIINGSHMSVELPHPELGGIGTITIYNSMGTDWQVDFKQDENPLRAAMIVFLKMQNAS